MKRISISLIAIVLIFASVDLFSVSHSISRNTSGGNGKWWNPWSSGYKNVNTHRDGTTGDVSINCSGNDSQQCPVDIASSGHPVFALDGPTGDPLTDLSVNAMNYIFDQVELGNFSGSQQFYTGISGTNYITNAIWSGDSTLSTILVNVTED